MRRMRSTASLKHALIRRDTLPLSGPCRMRRLSHDVILRCGYCVSRRPTNMYLLSNRILSRGCGTTLWGLRTVAGAAITPKSKLHVDFDERRCAQQISWAQQNECRTRFRHMRPTSRPPAFQLCGLEMCFGHLDPSFHVSRNRLSMVGPDVTHPALRATS